MLEHFLLKCVIITIVWGSGVGYEYDYTNGAYMRKHNPETWFSMDVRAIMQRQCVPIPSSLTLCRNVGYENMSLPNLLGHDTVEEVKKQASPWVPLYNVGCHPNTDVFLCSLYAPVCLDRPIYPCRSLCESVQNSCEARMNKYGFTWPDILKCDQFPGDDNLCIRQQNTTSNGTANVCHACKQPMTFESLLDSYCWASFVIRVRIKKGVDNELGDKKLVTAGKVTFYKPNNVSKEEMKSLELSITDGASCECNAVSNAGKKSLVMGSRQGSRWVVTYISDWSKDKEFSKALRAIRKGHDCKKQIEKEIGGQNEVMNGGLSISSKPPSGTVGSNVDVTVSGGKGSFEIPDINEDKNKEDNTNKKGKGKGNKKKKGKGKDKGNNKGKGKGRKGNNKDKTQKEDDPMTDIVGFGCLPCKQPLVFENLIEKYCASKFVLKLTVRRLKMDANGDKRIQPNKVNPEEFLKKEGLSPRDIRNIQPVIAGGSGCDCLQAKPKNVLFIMGKKEGGRDVVTFVSEMVKDSEFKRFTKAIQSGYDCSNVVQTN
ncbi:uncharacterized protein LOC127846532 isoform X4 [Dreissena polymorpha]|uniref:uncharacterized protein LOC127846532 isoform X4 n=1 Tax=Dreissena polymorpha TaxID=45954 RepID=UPI002264DF3D|nr:uncharacterized protein LOC127846532 isoform X4 [Dreissena polymorpha]